MSANDDIKTGFELDAIVLPPLEKKEKPRKPKADPDKIILKILYKIKKNDSFLTFTNQIGEVNRILQMQYASANDIAQVILNDIPLTSRLLKLVNSSYYSHFSQDGVSTITEAMIIVGTDQIKFLAASLKLIELMQNLGDSKLLIDKTLKCLQRSIIARQIAKQGGFVGSEKLHVTSILYDFGEYLVAAFDTRAYKKVLTYKDENKTDLQEAAKAILGTTYNSIGLLIARHWNLPRTVTNSMKPITRFDVKREDLAPEDTLPFICSIANDLCEIDPEGDKDELDKHLKKIRSTYSNLFVIPEKTLVEIVISSKEEITAHAAALQITHKKVLSDRRSCLKDRERVENGIRELREKLGTQFAIQDIFEMALNCLYDGFEFENVSMCIKNQKTDTMDPRYILGSKKGLFLAHFSFKIIKANDLFNQSLFNGTITVVENIELDQYNTLIPLWFKEKQFSDAFAIVPVGVDGKIVSMLYMDWNPSEVRVCDETKTYLERVRDLVIEALNKR